jgi:hypothetical protein
MPNPQIAGGRDFSEKLAVGEKFLENSLPYIPRHFPLDLILSQINPVNSLILSIFF